nr:4810_t:CDS:10 [Entrophospora candida]
MNALDRIQKSLQEISEYRQEVIQASNRSSTYDQDNLIYCQNLEKIVFNELKVEEYGIATDYLFESDEGIVKFLIKTIGINDPNLVKLKIAFLEFISLYIEKITPNSQNVYIKIKDMCYSILHNDSDAHVKAASFKPLIVMLDFERRIVDPVKLDIKKIIKQCLESFFVRSTKFRSLKVMSGFFSLLGIISRRFTEYAETDSANIFRVFINNLESTEYSDLAFRGLHLFLFGFPHLLNQEKQKLYVFQTVLRSISSIEDEKRYDIARTGFNFIIDHFEMFKKYYIQYYNELWTSLWQCREHKNADIRNNSTTAIGIFLKQLANILESDPIDDYITSQCVEFFFLTFVDIWNSCKSTIIDKHDIQKTKDISIAINGLGYFASLAKKVIGEIAVQKIYQELLNPKIWAISGLGDNEIPQTLSQIPLFIEAFCYIGREYEAIFNTLIETIVNEVETILIFFPCMANNLRRRSIRLILTCSDSIQQSTIKNFASTSEIINVVEDHTYKEMINFWERIFKESIFLNVVDKKSLTIDEEENKIIIKEFFSVLYDEFMQAFLKMTKKLNFTVIDQSESDVDTTNSNVDVNLIAIAGYNDLSSLKPVFSKDFIIFQNLVDFWQIFLPRVRCQLYSRWVYTVGNTLILLSTCYPYISGFYKMLGSCLTVCESIGFFDGLQNHKSKNNEESHKKQIDSNIRSIRLDSHRLFSKFIKEVCERLPQYKDDLLCSCLQLVLTLPKELINVQDLIQPIRIALKMGQSYQPLAKISLDTIDKLVNTKGLEALSRWLGHILPVTNEYLLLVNSETTNNPNGLAKKQKKLQSIDNIGMLNSAIISKNSGSFNRYLAWDPEKRLIFGIPYPDIKIDISLDELLPRIVEISESATDRKAKVVACELLHSIMLFMIGKSAYQVHTRIGPQQSPFYRTYKKVFPALFRLAIDTDQIPRKLFCPLISQMIHWFTNNAQHENPETIALLNCCLDAVCDTWGSLREYGAKCLNEFLLWSIKQSSQVDDLMNVKSIFKRIYNLCGHPDHTRRLGASLSINNIYRTFREEESLVDIYIFELLYWILLNLKLSDKDQVATGTRQQAIVAIRHIKKIICVKSNLFLTTSDQRRNVFCLKETDLPSLVEYLFNETTKKEKDYANICRELFCDFVVLLPDYQSGHRWISNKIASDPFYLKNLYQSRFTVPHLDFESNLILQNSKEWCLQFLSILENYTWLINKQLVDSETLINSSSSLFIDSLIYFIEKIVLSIDNDGIKTDRMDIDIIDDIEEYDALSEFILTPTDKLQWVALKAYCIESLINFSTNLLKNPTPSTIKIILDSKIYSTSFFKMIANCLFDYNSLELEYSSIHKIDHNSFLNKLEILLKLCKDTFSNYQYHLDEMTQAIAEVAFSDNFNLLCIDVKKSVIEIVYINYNLDPVKYIEVTQGYRTLSSAGIFPELFRASGPSSTTIYSYIIAVWNMLISLRNMEDPLWNEFAGQLLAFVVSQNNDTFNKWLLQFKGEALDILATFLLSDLPFQEIESCVQKILNEQLPLLSADYPPQGTRKFNEYISILDKLLKAMADSCDVDLFKILFPTLIREENHVHKQEIQQSFESLVKRLTSLKFVEITDIAYGGPKIFMKDFFKRHIKEIVDFLDRDERPRNDLEIVYYIDEKAETCEIIQAYFLGKEIKPKELTKKIIDIAYKVKSKSEHNDPSNENLSNAKWRNRCAAFNALSAAILCTQDKESFYRIFLFSENSNKGEYTWESIVNLGNVYQFEIELNQPFIQMKIDDFRAKSGSTFKSNKSGLKYLSSKYLLDSSFSQRPISLGNGNDKREHSNIESDPTSTDVNEVATNDRASSVVLEMDELNQHPCMRMLIKVISHLHTTICPPVDPVDSMPKWMKNMHEKFSNKYTHLNVHLFIAKIIINIPEVFEKYSKFWIRQIIDLVIEGDKYGGGINYFIQSYLMKNSYHESLSVVKNNLQIINEIFNIWCESFDVPTHARIGLRLMEIVLAHNKSPFQQVDVHSSNRLTEERFYRALINLTNHEKYLIKEHAAEICGMVLSYYRKHYCNSNKISVVLEPLREKVKSLYEKAKVNQKDIKPFIKIIHNISIHDHEIADEFLKHVLDMLPKISDFKNLALKVISFCAGNNKDLLLNMGKKQLLGLLKHRNDSDQLLTLKILAGILQNTDSNEARHFLDTLIDSFQTHSNADCRNLNAGTIDLKQKLTISLLQGLVDKNEEIKNLLIQFWYEQPEFSQDTQTTLKNTIGALYYAEIEQLFLNYSCLLLLERSKKSIEYKRALFQEPLPQSKFDENYEDIDTSWEMSNTMTPLFVNTPQTKPKQQIKETGIIKATKENFDFSMTLEKAIETQLGDFSVIPSKIQYFSRTPSQTQMDIDENDAQILSQSSPYKKLRRRTIRSPNLSQQEYYKQKVNIEKKRSELSSRVKPSTVIDKQVSMLRQYRVGELPDIMIKYSEIISPLQVLSQHDIEISRLLYTTLFTSIFKQMSDESDSVYKDNFKVSLENNIKNIFSHTNKYFPPFIGSIFRICYEITEIYLDPSVIRKASEMSSTESLGMFLIERQLMKPVPKEREHKRLRSENSNIETSKKPWMELAYLYRHIGRNDVCKGIFEGHIASSEYTKDALNAEMIGDYSSACYHYLKALKNQQNIENIIEENIIEAETWEEGRFECYEKLCQWDDLAETVNVDLDGDLEKLWSEEYQDSYLNYFFHSFFKLTHGTNDNNYKQRFYTFIDNAMKDPERTSLLELHFPIELALSSLTRKNYDKARMYVRKSYDNFLYSWTNLHPLATSTRLNKLSSLQQIEEYLNLIEEKSENINFDKALTVWKSRYPSKYLDSCNTWDDIVINRQSILRDMLECLHRDNQFKQKKDLLEGTSLLKMSAAARAQVNYEVAHSCLNKIRRFIQFDSDKLDYYQYKLHLQEASNAVDYEKKSSILSNLIEDFSKFKSFKSKIDLKKSMIASEAYSLLNSELNKDYTQSSLQSLKIRKDELINKGYDIIESASKELHRFKPSLQRKIFFKFAKYCDDHLRMIESDDNNMDQFSFNYEQYANNVVSNIMDALELNSEEASEIFPRLLQIIEFYEETQETFLAKAKAFGPVWKFIRWIPQIVAVLDKPIMHCVLPILDKLADEYPKSLYFPLRISSEFYNFEQNDPDARARQLIVERLQQKIKSDVLERLITELERLTDPEMYFNNWCQNIWNLVKLKDSGVDKREDGSKLADMTQNDFKAKIWEYFVNNIKKKSKKPSEGSNLLKSYSKWLAEFSSSNYLEEIEIPSQYDCSMIPDPDRHVKIARFDPRVLVLRSLRRPKRLTMIGTDGNEYNFLVKGGEDLRLDQRVQSLFDLMNKIMSKDFYCSQQKINLRTYKVVPMTGNLGIIEWINDTEPLRHFINKKINNESILEQAQKKHLNWIEENYADYQNMFIHAARDDMIKHFKGLQGLLGSNVLTNSLLKLAASPEVYLSLRSEFIKSLASINICGYLIGIGDRHLENFLVDMNKGTLISIDFGHAFGSATETLEIPELVPFRLTKQLESLMQPLGSRGLLEYPMIKIMQIMNLNKEVLLNVMEIFVKEPLLDWLTRAKNLAKQQSLICEELAVSHSHKPFFSSLERIAKGDPNHNIRARIPTTCCDIKQQIECLMDLATDDVVLNCMWVGWTAWA